MADLTADKYPEYVVDELPHSSPPQVGDLGPPHLPITVLMAQAQKLPPARALAQSALTRSRSQLMRVLRTSSLLLRRVKAWAKT